MVFIIKFPTSRALRSNLPPPPTPSSFKIIYPQPLALSLHFSNLGFDHQIFTTCGITIKFLIPGLYAQIFPTSWIHVSSDTLYLTLTHPGTLIRIYKTKDQPFFRHHSSSLFFSVLKTNANGSIMEISLRNSSVRNHNKICRRLRFLNKTLKENSQKAVVRSFVVKLPGCDSLRNDVMGA